MSVKNYYLALSIGLTGTMSAISPTYAIDLQGRFIVIEGLMRQYWTDGQGLDGQPMTYAPAPEEGKKDSITLFNGGAQLGWQPAATPSCQNESGFTSVEILYSQSGKKSGKFSCLPIQSTGVNGTSTSKTSGSYNSSSTVSGDTITLNGIMHYSNNFNEPGRDGSNGSITRTSTAKQSIKLQIKGSTCQVLAFSNRIDQTETALGQVPIGGSYKHVHEIHTVLSPTANMSCKFQ